MAKIAGQHFRLMKEAFTAVVNAHGGVERLRTEYFSANLTEKRLIWDVWRIAHNNLQYDDEHPFFKNGRWKRIYPYHSTFKMYPSGVNDSHIETALKRIAKDLGLI